MSQRRQRNFNRENEAEHRRPGRVVAGAGLAIGASFAVAAPAQAADFTVTNLDPTGPGSIRDAIDQANAAATDDRVLFQADLTGTIDLNSTMTFGYTGSLNVSDDLEILGPGADQIQISANSDSRVFYIDGPEETIDVTIDGLQLRQGTAKYSGQPLGGNIFAGDANLTISDSDVRTGVAFVGGGIFAAEDLTISNSTVSGNEATFTGGGLAFGFYSGESEAVITGSTFSGNGAASTPPFFNLNRESSDHKYGGGGILSAGADMTIARSTIANNSTAGNGGGVFFLGNEVDGLNLNVQSSTVSGNAAGAGGGIYAYTYEPEPPPPETTARRAAGDPNLESTIVAGNEADGPQFGHDLGGDAFNAAFSLIQDPAGVTIDATVAGSNIFGVDPLLGALSDNLGPTRTMRLHNGSPALDSGRTPTGESTDQRGLGRPSDLPTAPNAAGGDAADIGAYERQAPVIPPPTGVCKGVDATLSGSGQRDILRGTPGRDVIRAGSGNDVIRGRGGNDLICAGAGIDVVTGGDGNDRMFGNAGNDRLFGQDGRDYGEGAGGSDILAGGDHDDELHGNGRKDRVLGADGNDRLFGEAADDVVLGARGNDFIRGGGGNDRLSGGIGVNDVQQ